MISGSLALDQRSVTDKESLTLLISLVYAAGRTLRDASHAGLRWGWMSSCCGLRRGLQPAVPPGVLPLCSDCGGCYGFHRGGRSDQSILTFSSSVPDAALAEVTLPKRGNQGRERLNNEFEGCSFMLLFVIKAAASFNQPEASCKSIIQTAAFFMQRMEMLH